MDKPVPKSHFKCMSAMFKVRDFLRRRKHFLEEVGIKPGFHGNVRILKVINSGLLKGRMILR